MQSKGIMRAAQIPSPKRPSNKTRKLCMVGTDTTRPRITLTHARLCGCSPRAMQTLEATLLSFRLSCVNNVSSPASSPVSSLRFARASHASGTCLRGES